MGKRVEEQEVSLQGTPICDGIAIGRPFYLFLPQDDEEIDLADPVEDIVAELKRYSQALEASQRDLRILKEQFENEKAYDAAAILDAHLQILQDPLLNEDIHTRIRSSQQKTEKIIRDVLDEFEERFNRITNAFFRERFKDIKDVLHRLLSHLRQTARSNLAELPPKAVVFAKELVPSDIAEASHQDVVAFVTHAGGSMSHAAIIARAKGIPFVASVDLHDVQQRHCQQVVVDGMLGRVILSPNKKTLAKYQAMLKQRHFHLQGLDRASVLATETIDGYKVRLSSTIDVLEECDLVRQYGSGGVGLIRSESLFLKEGRFPSEEEQFIFYRQIVEKMGQLPVIIRTFDIGGDKFAKKRSLRSEQNPFLGCRAMRLMLREREIFKAQLRAILRVTAFGNVAIMFPMISVATELIEAKRLLEEVKKELTDKGEPFDNNMRIGCMIEVPSAALACDLLGIECDFLSIGTNDLVQYALAVDRGNQEMSYLYTPFHLSVIRLLKVIVDEANRQGIPVTICGEMASNPLFTSLLLGLGVREFSVTARHIPTIKHVIRHLDLLGSTRLTERVFALSTAEEIRRLLADEYHRQVPQEL